MHEIIAKAIQLKKDCFSCKRCPLYQNLSNGKDPHVYAYGNLASPVVFVAEAPGEQEVERKVPLIGRSGQVYEKYILEGLGLKREDVWTTNIVLCRPPGNRKPTLEERCACQPHLRAQLDLIKPKLIVALGSTPMETLLGIEGGITKMAGKIYDSFNYNINVFVMLHPSYIIRGGKYKLLQEHVELLKPFVYEAFK